MGNSGELNLGTDSNDERNEGRGKKGEGSSLLDRGIRDSSTALIIFTISSLSSPV